MAAMLDLSANNVKVVEDDGGLVSDAFRMSMTTDLAVYDTLYLSLAKRTGSVLITKDAGQARGAGLLGIRVEKV